MICFKPASVQRISTKGTLVTVELFCSSNHNSSWRSQPFVKGIAAGNLLLSAAILFSGNTYQRIFDLTKSLKLLMFSSGTYFSIQKSYLFPAVNRIYQTHRQLRLSHHIDNQHSLDLIGDGRCDSPGYNAKYGTYTVMNIDGNEIIDFRVVHKGQVANSSLMEKEGLKIVLARLQDSGVIKKSLATDRHKQIRKYMREEHQEIKHQFDVWHVTKSIKKKLVAAANKKENQDLMPWIKSIINHFWWCCASCKGDVIELKGKWSSLLFHIRNKHSWEGYELYKECEHPLLTKQQQRLKKWLSIDSPGYKALEKVISDRYLIADLSYMVDFKHTGSLEVYHALYNKYCPKRLHFSYGGMVARSQLAVLDFNGGIESGQATTKSGTLRYKQQYSKVTESWVVKPISQKKHRQYANDLMEEVLYLRLSGEQAAVPDVSNIPKNIAPVEKPEKAVAIQLMKSRFII